MTAKDGSLLSLPAFRLLLLLQALFGLAFSTTFLLPKYLTVQLGAGAVGVGLVNGAFTLGAALATPWIGRFARRIGRGRSLAVACAAMAVGLLLFVAVSCAGPLAVVARVIQGGGAAMNFAVGSVIVSAIAPRDRLTSAMALFITAGLVTNAVGPAATEWVIDHHGAAPAFVVAGIVALFGILPSLRIERAMAGAAAEGGEGRAPAPPGGRGLDRATLGLASLALVFGLVSGVMFTYHQPLALERGIGRVSDFLVTFTLTATALRLAGGRLMDRAGSHRLARWSLLGYAVALAAMLRLAPGELPWYGVLFGLFHGLLLPSIMALTLEPAGDRRESRAAWMNAGMNIGGLGVATLGPVAARAGYGSIFLTAGLVAALSGLTIDRTVPRVERDAGASP